MVTHLNRREALRALAAAGPLLMLSSRARADERPNIIFILTDDQRWDALGCAGHPFVQTPNMDRLYREGVRFANAFVTCSLCSPSRSSFLTGMYPHNTGVKANGRFSGVLPMTFLERLKAAGYLTAFIGKWHIGGLKKPMIRGCDQIVTFLSQGVYNDCPMWVNDKSVRTEGYITHVLHDYAMRFLEQTRPGQPFCLYLSHKAVHSPMTPEPKYLGQYHDAEIRLPQDPRQGRWADYNKLHLKGMLRRGETLEDKIRAYYETLLSVDDSLGEILSFLEGRGLAENTAIVFAGDNGFFWGEHGLVDKRFAYEESMRIPLLMRYPRLIADPGREIKQMALNIDLCPTVLELAGVQRPPEVQGCSWVPLLRAGQTNWREAFLYEYFYDDPWSAPPNFAVRTDDWKYITYPQGELPDELYHLAADPQESTNLIHDSQAADRVRKMKNLLEELKTQTGLQK